MRKSAGRLLFVLLIAMLAFPVVANAMYQFGDSPTVALHDGASAPAAVSQPTPATITVNRTSDNTLPTVLAAVSLGIALTGTAYVAVRLRSIPRT
jgi:hypothetical protein